MYVPWEQAWHEALYGPAGFYTRQAPADHFATSVQGIPGGGETLAAALAKLAREHRCTRIIDLGCGRGELLTHLRTVAPALHLTGVDVVEQPASLEGVVDEWVRSPGGAALPEELRDLRDTLVVAHEWLDVIPCPVVELDENGVWRVVTVAPDGSEEHGLWLTGEDLKWVGDFAPVGATRVEVGLPRDRAWADLHGRLTRGVVLAIDYGTMRGSRPLHGTLTGYRDGRQVPPVPDGACDLTAHVAIDSLVVDHPDDLEVTVMTQRDQLIGLLGDPSTPVPHGLASTRPAAYLAALSRRSALQALIAYPGLGSFHWVTAVRR